MNTHFAARTAAVWIVLALGALTQDAHAQAKKHASSAVSKHPPAAAPAEAAPAAAAPAAEASPTPPAAVAPSAAPSAAAAPGAESIEAVLAGVQQTGARTSELRKGATEASGERRELLLPVRLRRAQLPGGAC